MNNAYSRGNYPNYHPTIIQLSQNQKVCEALSLSLLKCSPEIHPLAPTNYPELRHWAPRVAVGFLSFEGFFEIPMRKNLMIHDDHGILMILMILELLHVASCPWLKNTTFNKSQTFISFCFYVTVLAGNLPLGRQRSLCSWRWNSFETTTKNPGTVNPFNICHSTCHPRSCRVRHSCSCQQLNDHRSRHGAVDLRASARRREPSQISLAR